MKEIEKEPDYLDLAHSIQGIFAFFGTSPEFFFEYVKGIVRHKSELALLDLDGDFMLLIGVPEFNRVLRKEFRDFPMSARIIEQMFHRLIDQGICTNDLFSGRLVISIRASTAMALACRSDCHGVLLGRRAWRLTLEDSVAEVIVESAKGDYWTGSAFLVAEDERFSFFLTCKHNVIDDEGNARGDYLPYKKISIRLRDSMLVAVELKVSTVLDVALVRCLRNYNGHVLSQNVRHGHQRIYSAGFPRVKLLEESKLMLVSGEIMGELSQESHVHLVCSAMFAPGNSGGPVLDTFGGYVAIAVAAIETAGINGAFPFSVVIPSELAWAELDSDRVKAISL